MLESKKLLVVRVDSTGFDPPNDRIIRLELAGFQNGELRFSQSRLVNPGRKLEPGSERFHGLTDAHLVDAPALRSRWTDPASFDPNQTPPAVLIAQSDILVSWNWKFTDGFLSTEIGPAWVNTKPHLCAMEAAKKAGFDGTLAVVISRLGISPTSLPAWKSIAAGQILWAIRDRLPRLTPQQVQCQLDAAREERDAWFAANYGPGQVW